VVVAVVMVVVVGAVVVVVVAARKAAPSARSRADVRQPASSKGASAVQIRAPASITTTQYTSHIRRTG
jgi:hypothetical protein